MPRPYFLFHKLLVPKVRVELTRVAPLVFETSASTIPPLRHVRLVLYDMNAITEEG